MFKAMQWPMFWAALWLGVYSVSVQNVELTYVAVISLQLLSLCEDRRH